MSTGLVFAPGEQHDLKGHPEHAGRMHAVWHLLQAAQVLERVQQLPAQPATAEQIERVHSKEQAALVRWACRKGGGMIGGDTYVTPQSYDAALLAAGGCCAAVDAVLEGRVDNAIALVRPPGHHAGQNSIEGFCLFNNIAVAARQAQAVHAVERIAIIDFDVHHGNGTQDIFYDDDSVLFFSIHMYASYFYPGSGRSREDGVTPAVGRTVNVPLPPGVGDRGYKHVFNRIVQPLLTSFRPQMLLVSVGFDAHWRDPLAREQLSLSGYADLTRRLLNWAEKLCQGRMVLVLEGGYDLEVLAHGVLNSIYALLGEDTVVDPIGPAGQPETDISDLLMKVQQQHLLA